MALPSHYFKKKILCSALTLICSSSLALAQNPSPTAALEEEALLDKKPTIDLSKVVVTAGGFEQDVKDAPASISVVTKKELEQTPFKDITDAIRDVPGVNVTGRGQSADISIRGMDPKYTLLMIDGKRIESRDTRPNGSSGYEQGWVPPLAAIERIEVVRGPMSSRYGSDAMGGVINVITKKINDEWGGNIRLETTVEDEDHTGNMQTAEVYLNGPIISEKLGLQLYGKYSHQSEGKYRINQLGKAISGSGKRKAHNLGGKLTFVPVSGQTFEFEAATNSQNDSGVVNSSIVPTSSDYQSNNTRTNQSIRYLGEFDNGIVADFVIANDKTDNKSRKISIKNLGITGNVIIPMGMHTVTVGGEYRDAKLNGSDNRVKNGPTKISQKTHALFIEDEWWLLDNFALTAGLRYDHDDKYGSNFTPRIYAVWNVNDEVVIKGGVSTGYAAPSLRETDANWGRVTGGRNNKGYPGIIIGNPDLKPEKTLNYEISVNYAPNDQFDVSATAFYTKFKDKIQIVDIKTRGKKPHVGPDGNLYSFIQGYENMDRAKSQGLEFALRYKPIEEVTLTGNYTWMDTEITKGKYKGESFTQTPKHMFNLHADWQINAQANVWAQWNYRGKETTITRQGGPGEQYAGYATIDLGGAYKLNRDTSLYGGIYNVANKKMEGPDYDRTIDGRRFWVGVNLDL